MPARSEGGLVAVEDRRHSRYETVLVDLRSRVLATVGCGALRKRGAEAFSVSLPSIKRWLELITPTRWCQVVCW